MEGLFFSAKWGNRRIFDLPRRSGPLPVRPCSGAAGRSWFAGRFRLSISFDVLSFDISTFLRERIPGTVLFDVRTPSEYAKGHIPGAVNLPLFDDAERAEVGTLYKRSGPEPAYLRGLDLAGAKMGWYIREAMRYCPDRRVSLYCWRGGKRSGSLASLLEFSGFEVGLLKGGYKAYRTHVLSSFEQEPRRYLVLGGKTGSGKTAVLQALRELGEQVLDLEGLARHKGSAFGGLGEAPQPTVEQFENLLHREWAATDPGRRVWVENESRSIGRVFIPQGFWNLFKAAPLIRLDIPFRERVAYLVRGYGDHPPEALEACLLKLERRMGGQQVKDALHAFREGDIAGATSVALAYYDKTYDHATARGNFSAVHDWASDTLDPVSVAEGLLDLAHQKGW